MTQKLLVLALGTTGGESGASSQEADGTASHRGTSITKYSTWTPRTLLSVTPKWQEVSLFT